MEHHIDRHFDEALSELSQQIKIMGNKVLEIFNDCLVALQTKNVNLATKVIDADRAIDAMEMSIDEQCLQLLARYQPAATDLRYITRGLKIVTDLERVGDLAVNCAERTIDIVNGGVEVLDISEMASIVQEMLKTSLDAFANANVTKADAVFKKEDTVDDMTEKYVLKLIENSPKNPIGIKHAFSMASIVRYLERVADHSTNIAELVIFMVKGRDVRHGSLLGKKL
jgi:phosphate transport system protein